MKLIAVKIMTEVTAEVIRCSNDYIACRTRGKTMIYSTEKTKDQIRKRQVNYMGIKGSICLCRQ